MIGTLADGIELLAANQIATQTLLVNIVYQTHISNRATIMVFRTEKVNETKSSHTTFFLHPKDCPAIVLSHALYTIARTPQVKYLGLIFDRRLTMVSFHLRDKKKMFNSRLHILGPLFASKT